MNYAAAFHKLFPGFFDRDYIRELSPEETFTELTLDLRTWTPAAPVPCPDGVTFGLYEGDVAALREAVALVDEDWVQYFGESDHTYCAFADGEVVAFCLLDDFGEAEGLRVNGPGCVGTVPAWRKQGIGLRLVQNATALLKEQGWDVSWIHYTHLADWYSRLGYTPVVRWNAHGIVSAEGADA